MRLDKLIRQISKMVNVFRFAKLIQNKIFLKRFSRNDRFFLELAFEIRFKNIRFVFIQATKCKMYFPMISIFLEEKIMNVKNSDSCFLSLTLPQLVEEEINTGNS